MKNDLIGLIFPIHHYITEIARFDWLSFPRALQSEPSFPSFLRGGAAVHRL